MFRTDAVKIIKHTIKPIGRYHPRSSYLPHVYTGPTVSSIFGTLPGSPFLLECQALCAIRPGSAQWFHFCKQEEVTGCQIRGVRWVGYDGRFVFRQKLLCGDGSVRPGVVMVKQPGMFSAKFGATSSHVFTQLPLNVAVELGIHSLAC
jgi:hypothetical protein